MKDYSNQVQELLNNPYRFSDVFKLEIPEIDIIVNDPRYKESILAEYLTTKSKPRDIAKLKEITHKHAQKYPKPDDNELVLHLRLGDAGWDQFNFIDELDKHIHKDQFSKITVVTALHFGNRNENYSKSNYTEEGGITWKKPEHLTHAWNFLSKLENKINSIGYDLNIYSNKNIDQDICYITQSNYFTPHFRRFSSLMLALLNDKAQVLIVGEQAQQCLDVLSSYNQTMFPDQPVKIPKKMTYNKNIQDLFLRTFYPNKQRLGNPSGDGGYVIAPNLNYDLLVSAGIDRNVTFEIDFQKQNPAIKTLAFDGTISAKNVGGIPIIHKNISTDNTDTTTNLIQETNSYKNIFLKMDIEGHEIQWLLNFPDLSIFKQITMEIHTFNLAFYEKILKTHKLIYVTPNNHEILQKKGRGANLDWDIRYGMKLPYLLEATFLRNSEFKGETELDFSPIPGDLSVKNVASVDCPPLDGYPWASNNN